MRPSEDIDYKALAENLTVQRFADACGFEDPTPYQATLLQRCFRDRMGDMVQVALAAADNAASQYPNNPAAAGHYADEAIRDNTTNLRPENTVPEDYWELDGLGNPVIKRPQGRSS